MPTPSVLSAGTFVASVMETAGYMTQARFLDDFTDFFREGGALIFCLAAVGAVFSFIMFGSYRSTRYLLVGPAIFWFLVGPRSETYGSVWQMGGGSPRSQDGPTSVEDAVARRNEVIEKATDGWEGADGGGGGEAIRVAKGFALFAGVINELTKDIADLFLAQEDGRDAMNFGKIRGFEVLTMVSPENSQFIEMLEQDFMVQCAPIVHSAQALASVQLQQLIVGNGGNAGGAPNRQGLANFYEGEVRRLIEVPDKFIGTATRAYIRSQLQRGGGGSNVSRTIMQDLNRDFPNISCGKYWELITEFLISIAERKEQEILRIARGDLQRRLGAGADIGDPDAMACQELQRVIYGETEFGGPCELKYPIALYMLKNQIGPQSAYARLLKRHWNTGDMINPIRNANLTPVRSTDGYRAVQGPDGAPIIRYRDAVSDRPGPDGQPRVIGRIIEQQFISQNPNTRPEERERWVEVLPHSGNQAPEHAMWISTHRGNSVNLRQQMFTWALQLPYWQGMILYLIAATYPFMALLVLLPGRAASFLNVPMAWLWAKSWDVGIAAVLVMDRVMWNMLWKLTPQRFDRQLDADFWKPEQLVLVLREAFKIDPGFNIHMYYMLVSMVLLAVPAVAGAMTIKAKRSILATFTEALEGHAKDAGNRRSTAFQMDVMNNRYGEMMDSGGVASLRHSRRGDGIGGQGRLAIGSTFGLAEAVVSGGTNLAGTRHQSGDGRTINSLAAISNAGASAIDTTGRETVRQSRLERAYDDTFHPEFGRWGRIQMVQDAYATAMDGSGGFEIKTDTYNTALTEFINTFTARAVDELKLVERGMAGGTTALADAIFGNFLSDPANNAAHNNQTRLSGTIIYPLFLGLQGEELSDQQREQIRSGIEWLKWSVPGTESMTFEEYLDRAFFITPQQTEKMFGTDWAQSTGSSTPSTEAQRSFLVEVQEQIFRDQPVGMPEPVSLLFEPRPQDLSFFDPPAPVEETQPFALNLPTFPDGGTTAPIEFALTPGPTPEFTLAEGPTLAEQRALDQQETLREIHLRVAEIPVQLPANIRELIAHFPGMADEAIEEYVRNKDRFQLDEFVERWNARRHEELMQDDQYRFRMAKALKGRTERGVEYTSVFGRRRRWHTEADIEDIG